MKPYTLLPAIAPEVGILASIPHTGTWMPHGLAERLAGDAMHAQPMCDWHLHQLYDFLPGLGIPVLHANASRFVVDLNRAAETLSLYPGRMETGVIATETFWGDVIWDRAPDEVESAALIRAWHHPYHEALARELDRMASPTGRVVLLDLHSVASRASRIHGPLVEDIYLGDRDGTSCDGVLTTRVAEVYRAAGFRVAHNDPYKGGYITYHYGQRAQVDALQIEMVQRVYMEEGAPDGAPEAERFAAAKARLVAVFEALHAAHCAVR